MHEAEFFSIPRVAGANGQRQAGWVLGTLSLVGKLDGNLSKGRVSEVVEFGALARKYTRERALTSIARLLARR